MCIDFFFSNAENVDFRLGIWWCFREIATIQNSCHKKPRRWKHPWLYYYIILRKSLVVNRNPHRMVVDIAYFDLSWGMLCRFYTKTRVALNNRVTSTQKLLAFMASLKINTKHGDVLLIAPILRRTNWTENCYDTAERVSETSFFFADFLSEFPRRKGLLHVYYSFNLPMAANNNNQPPIRWQHPTSISWKSVRIY